MGQGNCIRYSVFKRWYINLLLKYDLSKYNLSVYDYSKYKVDYHFNEEFTYDIVLNMELKEEKEDYIEIYKYTYNLSTDEINDYKTIFYNQG